jgi:glycosyltransferase involved in cell wall biosynthesis
MLLDRDEHFDIFHAYWLYPSAIACLIARRKQTKIVAAVCGYDLQGDRETRYGALLHPLKSLLSQKALCTADVIVTSFEIHSQTALRMVGTEMPGRIVFIPSCVDVKAIRAAVITRGKTREPLILFAPRVSELYGAVEFVEAALRLLRDHAETSFVLAGDGSLRNKLAKRVRSLGRDGRIRFTGRVSHTDFLGLISEASIVCDLASPGQGATTLEAQALGRVVVGVSGPKRLIIDGKTGILVPRGNTNELFLALKRLLSDKDEADRMAHQAYTSVVKNHDISLVVGKTLQIYDSLVQRLSR